MAPSVNGASTSRSSAGRELKADESLSYFDFYALFKEGGIVTRVLLAVFLIPCR